MQISAVCESIVASLTAKVGSSYATTIASGCVVGGVDFHRQRQAILGQQPRLLVATPGRLLSQCGVVPASSLARAAAAAERGEPTSSAAGGEFLPGRGSIAARRKLAARLAAEGKLPAPAPRSDDHGDGGGTTAATSSAVDLRHVGLLVLDEADRLLELGFEADLRMALSLLRNEAGAGAGVGAGAGHAAARRPRTLLFSATFSAPIRALASELLEPSALRITVEKAQGGHGASASQRAETGAATAAAATAAVGSSAADAELTSSASVTQRFEIHRGKGGKATARRRLLALLWDHLGTANEEGADVEEVEGDEDDEGDEGDETELEEATAAIDVADGDGEGTTDGGDDGGGDERPRVVVFALYKLEAKQLTAFLTARGLPAVALHGDMPQRARGEAMAAFRSGAARVLVATDVAARGLDVRHVAAVINTSLGMSLENYVHRVGRCGRAGATGVATTFVVDGDEALVPPLVTLLERSRQSVPLAVRDLARKVEADVARMAAAAEAGTAAADEDDEDDEAAERTRMQIANREKQLAKHRARKNKETKGGR